MIANQKYKVSSMAKDLNIKNKDLLDLLAKSGIEGRKHSSVIEPDEFNVILNVLTESKQIENFDDYMSGKAKLILKQEEKPAPQAEARVLETENKSAESLSSKGAGSAAVTNAAYADAFSEVKQPGQPPVKAQESSGSQTPQVTAEPQKLHKTDSEKKPEQKQQVPAKAEYQKTVQKSQAEKTFEQKQEETRREEARRVAIVKQNMAAAAAKKQREAEAGTGKVQNTVRLPHPDNRQASKVTSRFERKPDLLLQQQKEKKNKNKQSQSQQPNPNLIKVSEAETKAELTVQSSESRNQHRASVNTRVVDTRTISVDLAKYDEKLEKFVETKGINYSPEKQKLKKQNNKGSGRSEKDRHINFALEKLKKQELEKARKQKLSITIPDEIVVNELAIRLKVTASEVVKRLMKLGVMANINQVIDYDTAYLVADELGAKVTKEIKVTIEERLFDEAEDKDESLVKRPPVVVVMGHVDHGKTSLLDAIRHTNVTRGEAGGITQHIGAYMVNIKGQDITFLDTPGHEAFTSMRARGAKATDIAVLVVAADDGVMPQTVEAINHAKAAGLDIVVAINKMDKPGADPEKIKKSLTAYDLVPEEWGGDVICVPVSAVTKQGIDDLLESILIIAEMKELKANPNRRAKGIVIESKLDKGKGPVATVLVQNGTLKSGDVIIAGTSVGRIRAMTDENGKNVKEAGPSVPVEIIGLSEVPSAGDEFNTVEDERMARELAAQRRDKQREAEFSANAKVSLDDLFAQISEGTKEFNIIVKADVDGSAEAVKSSLEKLSNDEVKVKIIHSAVGGITEFDVMLAAASNAIIVGFNVRPDKTALDTAERQKIDIRTYRIIYQCIDEISAAMKGMLAPTFKEVLLGHIQVRQVIHVASVGTVAGAYVQDGKVTRHAKIRVLRDSVVINEDKIASLRRFKDDVKEVAQGYECGISLEHFNDIKVNDIFEAFEIVEQKAL